MPNTDISDTVVFGLNGRPGSGRPGGHPGDERFGNQAPGGEGLGSEDFTGHPSNGHPGSERLSNQAPGGGTLGSSDLSDGDLSGEDLGGGDLNGEDLGGEDLGESEPGTANGRPLPEATIARLPVYLRALYALAERGVSTVASDELAAAAGVNSAKLRKDLSHLGSYGIRGVGYDVEYLVYQVSRALGLTQKWPVVIVGAGNLGRALANYGGFMNRGFKISAILDSDRDVVGDKIGDAPVRHVSDLEDVVANNGVAIGVIAVPAGAAQAVCDRLVAAGVTSILNFAPLVLNVPEGVDVRKVDLSIELQILAFHAQRRSAERFGQVPGPAAVEA